MYDLGDTARLTVGFADEASGTPVDQTSISATVRKPDGTRTDYDVGQISHDGSGSYHLDLDADQVGNWDYEFTGDDDVVQGGFYVRPNIASADPFGRDLCSLRDVFRLVPGFDPADDENSDVVETLANLIPAESQSIYIETGREFVPIAGNDPRVFDLNATVCRRRSIALGDAAAVTQLELFDFDGTTSLGVVDANLYILEPRVREDWRPITRIRFPYRPGTVLRLAPGRTLAITATWGYPKIPADLRQACAKRVLLRYVADNANSGTRLADAIDDTFNLGALLRSSKDVVGSYTRGGFA